MGRQWNLMLTNQNCYQKRRNNEKKENLGEVVDILETGANLVLRVNSKGNSFLLPFVPAFIVEVNKEAHEITIREMEGLR